MYDAHAAVQVEPADQDAWFRVIRSAILKMSPKCLIVLDDVWDSAVLKPFVNLGK